jgi:hypothetical protein
MLASQLRTPESLPAAAGSRIADQAGDRPTPRHYPGTVAKWQHSGRLRAVPYNEKNECLLEVVVRGYSGRLVPLLMLSVAAKVRYMSQTPVASREKPTARSPKTFTDLSRASGLGWRENSPAKSSLT